MVNPTRRRSASPLGDARSPTRPRSSGMVDVVVGMHPAETPQQTPGGGRFAYNSTERLWPRDANSPQPHVHPVGDLQGLLQMLMQNLSGMPGGTPQQDTPEGGPRPPNPFAALFTPFLNPAAASHGDAVYTQEALDRVISQLMEQNPSSNAPGPASEAAIASLPKKKVDLSMLSDEGKADCSVCMDEVPIGEEVTSLPCSHWFHEQCATMWLKEHDTCPICRKGIMPKQGDGNQPRNPRQQPLNMEPWLRTGNEEGNMGMPGPFGFPPMRPGGPNVGSENSAHLRPHGHGGSQQSSSSTGGRRQSRSEDRRSSRGNGDSSSGSGIGDRMRGWFNGSGN
ncbi:MAG: hypothetical protein M1837_006865 [Sclerophora amabilis]|nr:MAG: hypothetical protein M1837_006865 [Sclerophora amabilis]